MGGERQGAPFNSIWPPNGSEGPRRINRTTRRSVIKIFIKDVKSSNGTFINGSRLSNEGVESEPFELKTEDVVVCTPPTVAPTG